MNAAIESIHRDHRYRGPHPGIVAIVFVILFMASLLLFPLLSNGSGFPSPFGNIENIRQLLLNYPQALKINAFLQFAAAVPLGIFTAAVVTRIRSLGVNVAGLAIAQFGGIAASILISISSLLSWILCQEGIVNDVTIVQLLRLAGFATGGIGHIVPLGLLLAGVSVPCLLGKYTPAWIARLGIILAVLAELSILGFVYKPVFILLPIVRFGSYIWMIAIGFSLVKINRRKE
jgi:hypothetical protein